MAARALLLSLLSRQCLLLKAAAFRERYPHGWLVWEAGTWNVPDAGEEMGSTRLPQSDIADCLPQSDVLCFEVAPPENGGVLRVGRAPENDIVINDATVSREHLELGLDGDRLWVKPLADASDAAVNGVAMDRIHRTPLVSGMRIHVGGVALTYLSPDSFGARVQAHADRLARAAADEALSA